jgi:hypothetical protein
MSPARNESGSFRGQTRISRRGRPALRLAAWRATWAVLRHCDVLAAKHAALTGRDDDSRLTPEQARVACAASLLHWIWSLIVTAPAGIPGSRPASSVTTMPWPHNRRPGWLTACQERLRELPRPSPSGERARQRVEDHLAGNPGQLPGPARGPSPARLNAAGTPSPLELRRAQEPRAAPRRTPRPATPARARVSLPAPAPFHPGQAPTCENTARIRRPCQRDHATEPLDRLPLRWFPRKRLVKPCPLSVSAETLRMCLLRPWQVRRTLCRRHFRSRGCPRSWLQSALATPGSRTKVDTICAADVPGTSPDTCGLTACQPMVRPVSVVAVPGRPSARCDRCHRENPDVLALRRRPPLVPRGPELPRRGRTA